MEIKRYEQRILIPDDGKYLYNEKEQVISDKVFLGIYANENDWIEIDENQKQEIEKAIEEELNNPNE